MRAAGGGDGNDSSGRKRGWQPMESGIEAHDGGGGGGGGRGDAIEQEMKKLRLAHDYNASRSAWSASRALDLLATATAAEPMDVEDELVQEGGGGDHNYPSKNSVLRECHYLRQLRRFQSERLRASFFERRPGGMDAPAQFPPQPRF